MISRSIILGIGLASFAVSCCGQISKLSDLELQQKYMKYSYGRSIAHDLLWSAGGTTLRYSVCRGRISDELLKRGYRWDGHSWVKTSPSAPHGDSPSR